MDVRSLDGLKVIDFGQGIAGPYCGQLLGDQGADVIKVEPPRGDWSRQMGRADRHGLSGAFVAVNRNKRGICLDLSRQTDRLAACELIAGADVVVESFRPGVMDRLGLGWQAMSERAPGLIYCSITGFGDSGPSSALPAGDSTMQAYGGLMSIVGMQDGAPMRVGNVVSDMVAGANAFSAVLLALLEKARSGTGQRVATSLLDSILAFQAPPLTEFLRTGVLPARRGNEHPLISPSSVYATSDGSIAVTVLDHQWTEFCRGLGVESISGDGRFRTSDDRQTHRQELNAVLGAIFRESTTAEWLHRLRQLDVLCAPVNDYAALVADPQVVHNNVIGWSACEDPLPFVRSPIHLQHSTARCDRPPMLGEHTAAVLTEVLGWEEDRISDVIGNRSQLQRSADSG